MKDAQNEAADAVNTDGQESGVRSNSHPSYGPLGRAVNENPDRGPKMEGRDVSQDERGDPYWEERLEEVREEIERRRQETDDGYLLVIP